MYLLSPDISDKYILSATPTPLRSHSIHGRISGISGAACPFLSSIPSLLRVCRRNTGSIYIRCHCRIYIRICTLQSNLHRYHSFQLCLLPRLSRPLCRFLSSHRPFRIKDSGHNIRRLPSCLSHIAFIFFMYTVTAARNSSGSPPKCHLPLLAFLHKRPGIICSLHLMRIQRLQHPDAQLAFSPAWR